MLCQLRHSFRRNVEHLNFFIQVTFKVPEIFKYSSQVDNNMKEQDFWFCQFDEE